MKKTKKRSSRLFAGLLAAVLALGSTSVSLAAQAYSPLAEGIKPVNVTKANFPDDTFRAYVSQAFDKDHNNILDPDELLVARNIHCDKMGIRSLEGIEHLVELRGVYASFNELTELDLSKNPEITGVWVSNNNFTKLDFSPNAKTLEWVYCFDNPTLRTLNLNGCSKLSYLECSECNLGKLDVTKFPELEHLICASCGLKELDLSKNPKLSHLDAFNNPDNGMDYPLNNKLTKLDLSHNPKMKRLDIWANYDLKFVDISVCPGLQYYNCAMIGATKVNVSKNPELNKLNCSYNKNLTSLDLSHNPKMACLICNDSPIKSLDLTHNPYMRYLHAGLCGFTSLNIGSCPYLLKTYQDGTYAREYMSFPDGDVPVGQSWTINYGGDDSTGSDQKFYIWIDDKVKLSTKAAVSIADLYPDQDKNVTNTANLMTREDFVQMLYEMAGSPTPTISKSRFKDVKAGAPYEDALLWGEANSICVGYPYSTADVFGTGKYISRQDVVFMLMRYSEYMDYKRAIDFGRSDEYLDYYDVDFEHWEAVCWSATWLIMPGKGEPGAEKSEQRIDPYGKATLDEIDEIMSNFCEVNNITINKIPYSRIYGANRYETAAAISKKAYPSSAKTVVLANGMSYADALAGVPLAHKLNAPILLTNTNAIDAKTLAEIKRLGASEVKILGGTGAISAAVEKTLKDRKLDVERIAGRTRFETAAKIADKMQQLNKKAPTEVFFVYYNGFADALSVSAAAAKKGAPIIYLTTKGDLNADTAAHLAKLKKAGSVKNAYVIGGKSVISDDMAAKAAKALGLSKATRVFGANRYSTCVEVNKAFKSVLTGTAVCVATGMNFPDALAGGVFAAKNSSPLFLASGSLNADQREYLKARTTKIIYVFGGTGAVPNALADKIAKASA